MGGLRGESTVQGVGDAREGILKGQVAGSSCGRREEPEKGFLRAHKGLSSGGGGCRGPAGAWPGGEGEGASGGLGARKRIYCTAWGSEGAQL